MLKTTKVKHVSKHSLRVQLVMTAECYRQNRETVSQSNATTKLETTKCHSKNREAVRQSQATAEVKCYSKNKAVKTVMKSK